MSIFEAQRAEVVINHETQTDLCHLRLMSVISKQKTIKI